MKTQLALFKALFEWIVMKSFWILNGLYGNLKKGIFVPNFEFGESTKYFSAIVNFYENETIFNTRPANKLNL